MGHVLAAAIALVAVFDPSAAHPDAERGTAHRTIPRSPRLLVELLAGVLVGLQRADALTLVGEAEVDVTAVLAVFLHLQGDLEVVVVTLPPAVSTPSSK